MPDQNQIYVYSVKFVCGTQEPIQGCTSVRPGVYATDINIHNFKDTKVQIQKFVLLLAVGEKTFREPAFTEIRAQDGIELPPNTATMDDCCRIFELLFPGMPVPPSLPLMIGFLVIESLQELSVTAVYTVTDLRFGFVSVDVEQVVGKLK